MCGVWHTLRSTIKVSLHRSVQWDAFGGNLVILLTCNMEGQQKHFSNKEECRGKREIWAKEAEKNRNFYKHSIFDFINRSMVHEPRSSFCAACRWFRNWFNRREKTNLTKLRFPHACSPNTYHSNYIRLLLIFCHWSFDADILPIALSYSNYTSILKIKCFNIWIWWKQIIKNKCIILFKFNCRINTTCKRGSKKRKEQEVHKKG